MARRSLSPQDIKAGMAYIHAKLVDQKLSAREVTEDPNLPFSLTTYYKYLPQYEKKLLKKSNTPDSIADEKETLSTAFAGQRNETLVAQNQELQDEINRLNRYIVQRWITNDKGTNESSSSNTGVH